ncbi:GNAT family N-acetyltransferase [Umezakia ovalisporum]|jgi:RimJ/RimL family protein N-acetyltransferase|uniref:GNAT family N-acetyltransferase n=1 Tax=Umezakia ovalisporum FSS-62 TaxID=2971776 RepID=A0AA43GXW7_9CYAN|nr:GNAT family N-acetyltransferase [Umezakia ovalisporum]MDH6063305.1 GNAT family N-acetyltransferase [Umezakia ovalisporum FSS-62]
MNYITFRLLQSSDSENLSNLLLNSSSEYVKYFHPFDFQALSIQKILDSVINDKFFGIEVKTNSLVNSKLIGFYMLRGMDEGYIEPMYGVFIDQQWQNKGIAKLSLYHAECFCKINSYKRLLLKVNSDNYIAKNLYESIGFKFLKEDTKISNIVLFKDL